MSTSGWRGKPALRPSTYAYRECLARYHVKPALGKTRLKDLKLLGISLFYADLAKAGVSVRRVFKVHRPRLLGHFARLD